MACLRLDLGTSGSSVVFGRCHPPRLRQVLRQRLSLTARRPSSWRLTAFPRSATSSTVRSIPLRYYLQSVHLDLHLPDALLLGHHAMGILSGVLGTYMPYYTMYISFLAFSCTRRGPLSGNL